MYPVTVTGRILTCLCALVGASMMGMLVSVLVSRYQQVYDRKMFVHDPEISAAELEERISSQGSRRSSFVSQKLSRRRELSTLSHHLPSISRK